MNTFEPAPLSFPRAVRNDQGMAFSPLVVIGGSAGAMAPLRQIVSGFPSGFAASVLVVLHLSPAHPSILADILDRSGPLPAREAQDGDPLRPGEILVAPADHHLLTGQDSVQVTQGAVENRSRPSIDVLFRSAARTHGTSVIGVVLSGLLGDGAAGLAAIKQAGGRVLVQHPDDAAFRSMPMTAARSVNVDALLPAGEMAQALMQWAHQPVGAKTTA